VILAGLLLSLPLPRPVDDPPAVEIAADVLEDRIHGGLLAQILGNLNGLPHEFKYIEEPGRVESYTPALPEGARTDDDTDIEWVYLHEMARTGEIFLPPGRVRELWRTHINKGIWCANLYARCLMDLGLEPPLTGRLPLNPWASFNISGQFVSECFGLAAPAMPRTASRIGLHYTRTAVDGEPLQATRLFCTMIASAFVEADPRKILEAGLAALDPSSALAAVAADVRRWRDEHPGDWRACRFKVKEKYQRHGGGMRDRNGHELNTAGVLAALLYGGGDLVETLRLAFNFGWDADCNAATAGTIVGVLRGRRWMEGQGWTIRDVYRNTTRDELPRDETISGFAAKIAAVARRVILAQGGEERVRDGRRFFLIRAERPAPLEPLPTPEGRREELRQELGPGLERDLKGAAQDRARAAYLAIALGEADRLAAAHPSDWAAAVEALGRFPGVLRAIFDAPRPFGDRIRERAAAEGLGRPPK